MSCGLSGAFLAVPPSTRLVSVQLSSPRCNVPGCVRSELGSCAALTYLSLFSCSICFDFLLGAGTHATPAFPQLIALDASYARFQDRDTQAFAEALSQMSSLRALSLRSVQWRDTNCEWRDVLGAATALTLLDAGDFIPRDEFRWLSALTRLERLSVRHTGRISGVQPHALSPLNTVRLTQELPGAVALRELDVRGCGQARSQIEALNAAVPGLSRLTRLFVDTLRIGLGPGSTGAWQTWTPDIVSRAGLILCQDVVAVTGFECDELPPEG